MKFMSLQEKLMNYTFLKGKNKMKIIAIIDIDTDELEIDIDELTEEIEEQINRTLYLPSCSDWSVDRVMTASKQYAVKADDIYSIGTI